LEAFAAGTGVMSPVLEPRVATVVTRKTFEFKAVTSDTTSPVF
jgi:hypothetical protein